MSFLAGVFGPSREEVWKQLCGEIGEDFIGQGNDETKVKALFANPEIRRLIQEQPQIRLELKDDEGYFCAHFPEGVDELHFQVTGVIRDVERLKKLFDLFAEVLEEMHRLGFASDADPGVKL